MSRKFLLGLDVNNQRIVNLASPSTSTDAANKAYVDALVNGLTWKDEVRAATTTNGALATAYAAGQVIDGVTLATGDRILVKDQTTATENGIYIVAASGAPTRATDADATTELNNATVKVTSGTANVPGSTFTQTTQNPVVGTSNLVFVASSGGTTYTADGTSLTLSGTTFSVNPNYAGLAKRYATNVPTTGTTVTITHSLGTTDITVAVYDISTANSYVLVEADIIVTGVNTLTLGFATTPTTGQYRCVITA